MDSKWGGLVVAALAGLGFVCFINRQPQRKVMESETVKSHEPPKTSKRPPLDDFLEINVAKMVEHLKWVKSLDDENPTKKKILNRKMEIDAPLKSLENTMKNFNEKRKRDGKKKYPPIEFHTSAEYAAKYGKCPEGWKPETDGWVTGKCWRILADGTKEEYDKKKAIGSGGVMNNVFQYSGYLKLDTPMATDLARETLHETGKYYEKGKDSTWKDKDPLEKLRAQYYDKKIQKEVMKGQTLDEYAHWLWLEQFTKHNRKALKSQGFFTPFDIDTCRKWLEYLYVEQTFDGYVMEEKALEKFITSYQNRNDPIYRYVGEVDANGLSKTLKIYDPIRVTYTDMLLDGREKVDILIRPTKSDGDIVLAGVQVKPLSFFKKEDTVRDMLVKHRIIGGDEAYFRTKTHKDKHGRPMLDLFPDSKGDKERSRAKCNFNVQTLVYDTDTKRFLNYEAVLRRIDANIPDPIITQSPPYTKEFFVNQILNESEEFKAKMAGYVNTMLSRPPSKPAGLSPHEQRERQARHEERMLAKAQRKREEEEEQQRNRDERERIRKKVQKDLKRKREKAGPSNPFPTQGKSPTKKHKRKGRHKKRQGRHY